MQNLGLFLYVHVHITTFRVWKNNIGKWLGGGGIKDIFKGGGVKEGGDKSPMRTMLENKTTILSSIYNLGLLYDVQSK